MRGSSEYEASKVFTGVVRRALTCFVPDYVNLRPSDTPDEDGNLALALEDGQDVSLVSNDPQVDIWITVMQWYRVEKTGFTRNYKPSTTGYWYILTRQDHELGEIELHFHWHPYLDVKVPHVHVETGDWKLSKSHIYTGRTSVEHVLLIAQELGAQPQRDDWMHVLRECYREFESSQNWVVRSAEELFNRWVG